MEKALGGDRGGREQRPEQRALTGPVRTEDADAVVAAQGDVHVAKKDRVPELEPRLNEAQHPGRPGARLVDPEIPADAALEADLFRLCPGTLQSVPDQVDLSRQRSLRRPTPGHPQPMAGVAVVPALHLRAGAHASRGLRALLAAGGEPPLEPALPLVRRAVRVAQPLLLGFPQPARTVVAPRP